MQISRKLALGAILACAAWVSTTMAATEQQKLDAINKGLANLYATQQTSGVYGYWNYGGYEPAATGASVLAFMSQKNKWGSNAVAYKTAVDNAMKYLFDTATIATVSTRNDGVNICPGGGSCTAVYWLGAGESSYTTGLIAPAIATYVTGFNLPTTAVATTSGPLAGLTWGQIAQAITNTWSASQSTVNQGVLIGGWRYGLNDGYDSDMSTTQWGIISLIYDQTLGATTPAIVKTDLAKWLAFAQDPASGAGCYQGPGSGICDHSDTGGLLLGLNFVGKNIGDSAVQKALTFLNNNWPEDANGTWWGNFGHPYAMWGVYKGLETNIGLKNTTSITNLKTTCGAPGNLPGNPPGSVPCNWWEDYNESLVTTQNPDGSWDGYSAWYGPLATAFNVSILAATQIPQPNVCDVDSNGKVDKLDLALISKARGQVPGLNDPRDANHDGKIDARDVKICIPQCTFAQCSVQLQPV